MKEVLKNDIFKKLLIIAGVSFLIIFFSQNIFFNIKAVDNFELNQIDERFQFRGSKKLNDTSDIIILEINDITYKGIPAPYNSWPFPRNFFAKVIRNLTAAGVKAIGIDIVMSSADKYNTINDSLFALALRDCKNVVLGGKVDFQISEIQSNNGNSSSYELQNKDDNYGNIFFDVDSSIGIVNVVSDNDGVVRRYLPFRINQGGERIPTFGFQILNKFYGKSNKYTITNDKLYFHYNSKRIPKFDKASFLIDFWGGDKYFPRFNFLDVLDDSEFKTSEEIDYEEDINVWDDSSFGIKNSGIFKNKIVLIGSTLPEDKDIIPISFSRGEKKGDNLIYGIELHGHLIHSVIKDNYLYNIPIVFSILSIIFLTAFVFAISSKLKGYKVKYSFLLEIFNILLIILLFALVRYISLSLFANNNIIISTLGLYSAILFGYFSSTAYHFIIEKKQKTAIKGMFSQYLSGAVVEQLISDPSKLKLGGEKKELTVLFSDIAEFSTFSESQKPEDLIHFLNDYLTEMTGEVFINKGTLDKYLGDSVMAFWGAPLEIEEHSYYACKTAISMQKKLKSLQGKWGKNNQDLFFTRIGINTGDVIVGNIGGEQRFDYTVIGDNVNLASRLEGVNKMYGTKIIISESTYEKVKVSFICRELDSIRVKGRMKPLKIYELIDIADATIDKSWFNVIESFEEGLNYYRNRDFDKAITDFKRILLFAPNDIPSKLFIERCEFFLTNPPTNNWDGVFTMQSK